jgi:hypothetical protein
MTTVTSIYTMLKEDTTARLKDQLETQVTDDSKVLVYQGNVKQLPTDNRLRIEVKTGNAQWRHTLNVPSENVGSKAPLGEIGGRLYWRERFIIGMELFFAADVTQDAASTIADVVLSRARWSLSNLNPNGTWWFRTDPDYFGETASQVQVMNAFLIEGGSDTKWTWRGEVWIEFITGNDGCV